MPLILDEQYRRVEVIDAEPECGEDFCDQCGDCLACYSGDPCYDGGDGHTWVVYAEDVAAFKERIRDES
jgi:hypothetical protein